MYTGLTLVLFFPFFPSFASEHLENFLITSQVECVQMICGEGKDLRTNDPTGTSREMVDLLVQKSAFTQGPDTGQGLPRDGHASSAKHGLIWAKVE